MKKVCHWTPDMRVPKVLLPAPKKLDFGQDCSFLKDKDKDKVKGKDKGRDGEKNDKHNY